MNYDGRAIANYVLDHCAEEKRIVTNLSLQKIIYFCHVWCLIKLGKPLVKQQFEAWQHGPVIQYLYHQFKVFDRAPIETRATKINQETGKEEIVKYEFDDQLEEFLSQVIRCYSKLSVRELVDLSHEKNGPWDKVWNHGGRVNPGMKISNSDILEFYSKANGSYRIQ